MEAVRHRQSLVYNSLCWHTMMSHIPPMFTILPLHSTEPTTAPLTWIERLHTVAVPSVLLEQNQSRDETLSITLLTLFCFVFKRSMFHFGESLLRYRVVQQRWLLMPVGESVWKFLFQPVETTPRVQAGTPSVQNTEFLRTETSFSHLGQ